MDAVKGSTCRAAGGQVICSKFPKCGVCPPCPAPCNPAGAPCQAEIDLVQVTLQLRQAEETLKNKTTECAILRAQFTKKKEDLDKEKNLLKEAHNKLKDYEIKFNALDTHTKQLLGQKALGLEQELNVNVRVLKNCYKEAKEEIDDLRSSMKEQNEQIQDYRMKYLEAQQTVEEQKRSLEIMDMDNIRVSEQINLEIQKIKLKFQEKLQELSALPDQLKATQIRLEEAQEDQALAEHKAEHLVEELSQAREKIHVLLFNSLKEPEKMERDEKQIQLMQQRIQQLTENNQKLRTEVDRLKANVIHMEEAVLANELRLQEKMHECVVLGGELDRARDEAARAVHKANERTETIRVRMNSTVDDFEKKIEALKAASITLQRDRDQVKNRMQSQISKLHNNYEQAQVRILELQNQVRTLRQQLSNTMGDDDESEEADCTCKEMLENN